MRELVDLSTILAAVAGLWALAIAWWTYVATVHKQNQDWYDGLKSVLHGLRSELDFMKYWSGSYSDGYPQDMKAESFPEDWSYPTRLIWGFPYDTIKSLPRSVYASQLKELVGPFLRLSFSVSKFLQFHSEYRLYVLSQPSLYHFFKLRRLDKTEGPLTNDQAEYAAIVRDFNYRLHVHAIGGQDSPDPECLYKAHKCAFDALNAFESKAARPRPPKVFWLAHIFSAIALLLGVYLIIRLLR